MPGNALMIHGLITVIPIILCGMIHEAWSKAITLGCRYYSAVTIKS